MTGNDLRTRFLDFFAGHDHLVLGSAPLIPQGDATTLLISAGMHPLKPFYTGERTPPHPRLASCQKCLRTGDIEEVGKTDRHCTFFEMLGNFAPTGDYFKESAIPLAWQLVTEGLGIPGDRVRVTRHPTDPETEAIWYRETDLRPGWVYENEENYWYGGATGPCGPDSELWYDRGPEAGCGQEDCYPDHCTRFLEFWNLVFMQFDRGEDGTLTPLPRPGIDTGMGLERMASVLQGVDNNFDTDLFRPLMDWAEASASNPNLTGRRVIADHLRAMTFLIADGVMPGTVGRGYVLRRIIRRAAVHARRMGMAAELSQGCRLVAERWSGAYPELAERLPVVVEIVDGEAGRFTRTLEQGIEVFEGLAMKHPEVMPGTEVFKLHDTYGFPVEMTREMAAERGIAVDMTAFESSMAAQRARSRTTSGDRWPDRTKLPRSEFVGYRDLVAEATVVALIKAGHPVEEADEGDDVEVFLDRSPFYAESGGQVGDAGSMAAADARLRVDDVQKPGESVIAHSATVELGHIRVGDRVRAEVDASRRRATARHHSATHLVHKALRQVLGETATQRGSYVGPDHTTFDFAFGRALTEEEIRRVSRLVNDHVRRALPMKESHMTLEAARQGGAMALFGEKYADVVRVICFGDWSCELCGGTHVESSADVGPVLVLSERSIGAGLRRVDLVAGEAAEGAYEQRTRELETQRETEVAALQGQVRDLQRRLDQLQRELRTALLSGGASDAFQLREAALPLATGMVHSETAEELGGWADQFMERLGGTGVVAVGSGERFVIKVSRNLAGRPSARDLAALLGTGGGRPDFAQGKFDGPSEAAFEALQASLTVPAVIIPKEPETQS